MNQDNFNALAEQYMAKAVRVESNDNVWIEYQGDMGRGLAESCSRQVEKMGGVPFVVDSSGETIRSLIAEAKQSGYEEAFLRNIGERKLETMQRMAGYIRICDDHDMESAKIPASDMGVYSELVMKQATDYRVRKTRWLVVASPTPEFATACNMPVSEFNDFYLNACLADYSKMADAVKPLQELMDNGSDVHITGEETDIRFSIKGIHAQACTGERNIPDGECYTAPVRDSVNGFIKYGPSSYRGVRLPWIKLVCENGKIVDATSSTDDLTRQLNEILDKDAGARYFGEFAIAFNPAILHPVGSILFDEKIAGSFHLTPGQCYEDVANNGNKSSVHWDMVKIQRPEYGGGDIVIDGELIRRDGLFVPERLLLLNPGNLTL